MAAPVGTAVMQITYKAISIFMLYKIHKQSSYALLWQ